jgi:hypothetical protein
MTLSPQNTKVSRKAIDRKIVASKANSRTVCRVCAFNFFLLLIPSLYQAGLDLYRVILAKMVKCG